MLITENTFDDYLLPDSQTLRELFVHDEGLGELDTPVIINNCINDDEHEWEIACINQTL